MERLIKWFEKYFNVREIKYLSGRKKCSDS
jgi:hypothetical protein